jgi:hypothetical protein
VNRHRPHHTDPSRESVRLVLAYKNFAAHKNISHIGLGVAALNTSATLRRLGYWVEVWAISTADELEHRLATAQAAAVRDKQHLVSHVVISAPWIPTDRMQRLLMTFPAVDFATVSHSNMGFLMADPSGIRLLREATELTIGNPNLELAGNCTRFCEAWGQSYGVRPRFLPNLYDVSTIRSVGHRPPWRCGPIRVGVFGAIRPLKNQVTAVSAAIQLGARLRTDTEIWMSTGRTEGGGTVELAIQQLTANLAPHVRVIPTGWRSWPAFRAIVARMHVLLNVSYTESFCMVAADGIAEGVASVVSEAIDWTPADWMASVDDASAIASVAHRLLYDTHAVDHGQHKLRQYVNHGVPQWVAYLRGAPDASVFHHRDGREVA